jgi:hypothetical protein
MSYENISIYLNASQVEDNVQTVTVNCNLCTFKLQDLAQKLEVVNLVQLENKRTLEAIQKKLTHQSERECIWK